MKEENGLGHLGYLLWGTVILLFVIVIVHDVFFNQNDRYNYAYCNSAGMPEEIEVKKWRNYKDEQIKITTKNEEVYIVGPNICTFVEK